jgi:DNA-binding CsgD family transcriptional regulator
MFVSAATVKTHVPHIFAKLDVTRSAELASGATWHIHDGAPGAR